MNCRRATLRICSGKRTRRISFIALVAVGLLFTIYACRPSARRIAEDLSKSTLFVETFDAEGKPLGQGTAFFISADTALTNMHVMKWAKTMRLSSPARGVSFDVVAVVGVNFDRDLCVLRVTSKEGRPLSFASKGSVAVGDRVFVAGNPKGLTGTVSTGIVSSVRGDAGLIQIDAPISPGSSGGPVVNDRGEVLGVATLSLVAGQNLNFAVETLGGPEVRAVNWPVFDVGLTAISDLERSRLKGRVRRVRAHYVSTYPSKPFRWERELDEVFNENGMWTSHDVRSVNEEDGTWEEPKPMTKEHFDSRVVSKRTDMDGKVSTYSYDEGRRVGARSFYGKTQEEAGLVTYDAFGNRVRQVHEGFVTSFFYDKDGLLVQERTAFDDGTQSVLTYEYEFDEIGNWIEMRRSDRRERWTRKIEYFEGSSR